MMKLTAFRIKNFRSIVDTGWQSISPDNITCLIGQNESGKTSVLEALKVFYSGVITEDILRSDLSLPEVSCRFSIPQGWLLKVTDNPGTELKELLSVLTHVEISRFWIADLSSIIKVSGEISHYLDSLEDAWRIYLDDVCHKLEYELTQIADLEHRKNYLEKEEASVISRLSEADVSSKGFRLFGRKSAEQIITQSPEGKKEINEIRKSLEKIRNELSSRKAIRKTGEAWKSFSDKFSSLDKRLEEISIKLEERHQKMTLLMRPLENMDDEWKGILAEYKQIRIDRESARNELDSQIALSGYILEGVSENEAISKVSEIIKTYKSQYNSEILGKKYFEYCPVFELFEDFGSLLPNRIDMEDIILNNENIEGFKAARNFLSIAQLDYSFFQQPSSRILKQKIENLNHSLTKNFQDFWQQSVGRNNKINIQFELDHYNASYGSKAGKPYLEFWIKDEGERLYPKQRSRGVRWFLSFYMELKAAANTGKEMVLLVDEPGVSLHARAQEDVLKVFEDIKDKIQVIYTTHSPHLVEINKLHRVLAVQRDDLDSMRSTTRIIDPLRLSDASPDTLSPLQSILGNPHSSEGFSSSKFNLIVNDTGSFYMINAILSIMDFKGKVSIIPSTGVSNIPLLCNILMGWGMEFGVLLFNNEDEIATESTLRESLFKTELAEQDLISILPENVHNAEDLLSTLDFKNHIIRTREGIIVSNSEYLKEHELPRNFLLSRFLSDAKHGMVTKKDFDEESLENFRLVVDKIKAVK